MQKEKKIKQSKRQTGQKKEEKKANKEDVGFKVIDPYGLGQSFMELSDFMFGKGWNKK
jgi:hypothetical protein